MKGIGKIMALSSCLYGSFVSNAQEKANLNPVTVTATVQPARQSQTGRNILVVSGEKFNDLPVHSIDDLLRYLPGVEVQQRGMMGSQSDIVLRGGTFQQVLIILDGIRINDPNTGHFNSYIPIAPAEIERIEILKGASSAIYGSEAVGGVIHVITKVFAAKQGKTQKGLSANLSAGEYNLRSANAGGLYQKGNTIIGGGVLTNNSDGQLQRGTRSYFHNHTASLSLQQFIGNNLRVSARTSYDDRKFSAQNFYTTFLSDTAKERVKTWWNQVNVSYQKDKAKFALQAGYKNVADNYAFNTLSAANENKSALLQGLLTYDQTISNNTSFTAGLQAQQRSIRSNDRGNHHLKQGAAFLVLHQTVARNLFLSPAVRIDYHEQSGAEIIPQLNVAFQQRKWQVRGSIGKTIREADFTERYNNYNKTFVSGGSVGNPDLQPERSLSYEAGVDYFGGDIKLSATAFRREQKELIDWVTTAYANMPRKQNLSPTGSYALASNISTVNTTGVETDIQYSKKLGRGELSGSVGALWLESASPVTEPSFYLSSHARWLGNFNLQFSRKKWSVAVNGIYKNRKHLHAHSIDVHVDENCFMMNAKASYTVLSSLAIFTEVDNLTGARCRDIIHSVQPTRWVMAGIKYEFLKRE